MRGISRTAPVLVAALAAACAGNPDRRTLAELRDVEPDVTEVRVTDGLEQAMSGYRKFLEEAPESALTPEAMRRLADLKLEKEYGITGAERSHALPSPQRAARPEAAPARSPEAPAAAASADAAAVGESDEEFELRATRAAAPAGSDGTTGPELPGGRQAPSSGPQEAIALYDEILEAYPHYAFNDQILYQKARAYDELGRPDDAIAVMERLVAEYPDSRHLDEVHFRRGEYFFVRKRYRDAEDAYAAVTRMGAHSDYYELALYKLGWAFYKQYLHEEALDRYVALLDYKVDTGYDFDQLEDESAQQRIEDTFRVISLSFSNLGGPPFVRTYFEAEGSRSYEDRIYRHLGEFYLDKLRYHDAAAAYRAFVDLYPLHRASPHFGMRIVEIYEAGGFPKLVLESKKDFAATYGLQSDYWRHFDPDDSPEVLSYLKRNLQDLANHYHARYQDPEQPEDRPAHFAEALRWYRAFLVSFPQDAESPSINHRLADLLLENEDFGDAAREYERTAYAYGEHDEAGAAGYAAIYAHREHEKRAAGEERERVRREAVASTLRFVDAFPAHDNAAAVLGAAIDDLYDMQELEQTIATAERLLDAYPEADPAIRRAAWAAIAHASFDLAAYAEAETAYARVLEMTPAADEARQATVDNLAAAIYKQGEQAKAGGDARAAADHFLRIATVAPTSSVRPIAEYDASAALIELEDWAAASAVLEAFQQTHPEHELHREATRQMAFVQREAGNLARAAAEYERVAAEAEDADLRGESLLLAGELYEEAGQGERALTVYRRYVEQFPRPLETAVETRFRIAEMLDAAGDEPAYHDELIRIVEIDRSAGAERTARIRYLAARSALVLAELLYARFGEVELVQPFDRNLREKQRRMEAALEAFGALVDYEVGEVTAAATFYVAEVYFSFSQALLGSERPAGLGADDLQVYEMALEEEAFPFEEQAIDVHEKNLELMSAGVYNAWIEKSLERLAVLVPGRYAKFEASSGWIETLDRYAYHAPDRAAPPTPEPAAAAVPESTAGPAAPELTVSPAPEADAAAPVPASPAADAYEEAAEGPLSSGGSDALAP